MVSDAIKNVLVKFVAFRGFKSHIEIWIVSLGLECQTWFSSTVDSNSKPLFYISTLHLKNYLKGVSRVNLLKIIIFQIFNVSIDSGMQKIDN